MIDKIEIIQKMVIESACNFEYLSSFQLIVKKYHPHLSKNIIKSKSLILIEILLKKNLLDVYNIKDDVKWEYSVNEIVRRIDEIWIEGASYIDLTSNIYFKRQIWFYKKLKSSGYNFKSNWIDFVCKNPWLQDLLKIDN